MYTGYSLLFEVEVEAERVGVAVLPKSAQWRPLAASADDPNFENISFEIFFLPKININLLCVCDLCVTCDLCVCVSLLD